MDFLNFHKSKKTSESGIWISDEEADNCACCGTRFNLIIRKHHCRVRARRSNDAARTTETCCDAWRLRLWQTGAV